MISLSYLHRLTPAARRPAIALGLAAAIVVSGTALTGRSTVEAQAPQPCGLLTSEEVQALAPNQEVSEGAARSSQRFDSATCRYMWGEGIGHSTLAISVNPASRMFAGMSAEAIRQHFAKSVMPETADEAIGDVGDAAVFKSDSSVYATASAYVKGRILQVTLDGVDARDMKGQLIALLRSAASRL
jgi:hypothetical protein